MYRIRTSTRVSAGIVAALMLLPIIGVLIPLGMGSENIWTGTTLSWPELWAGTILWKLLSTTLLLGLSVGILAVFLGTALAWLEMRAAYPGRKPLTLLTLLPLAMPSYVVAATVAHTLGPGGWLGDPLGLPRFSGFWQAVLVLTVVCTPYVQLLVGAAIARLSAGEEEVARTLGAGGFRVFTVAVLPRIRPAMAFSGLVAALYAVSDFGAVAVLDLPVLTWRLFDAVQHQELLRAGLLGVALLVAAIPLFVGARLLHGKTELSLSEANPRPPARIQLGTWGRVLAYGLHLLVAGVGAVVPLMTMGLWVWGGWNRELTFAPVMTPVFHSLWIAVWGAILIVAVASIPAWVVARSQRRSSTIIEQCVYLSSGIPGVLIAFGLMLVALAIGGQGVGGGKLYPWLLSSGFLLFLGYTMRFSAEVYGPLKTAVRQLDTRQEESAQVLGASFFGWWRSVAWAGLRPGIAASLVIGLIAVVKELPVTLLLGGATGMRPLAFRVWDRYNEALWHDAGLAGLWICGLAIIGLTLSLRWRRFV